jgi:hypothetical protein
VHRRRELDLDGGYTGNPELAWPEYRYRLRLIFDFTPDQV